MCMYINNRKPTTALEPIRVWKRLLALKVDDSIRYITPYRGIEVSVGYSLRGLKPNAPVREEFPFDYNISVQGVHAYTTRDVAEINKRNDEIITVWEIPAGTKYWVGNGYSKGQIAATEMKFIKICEN